MNKTGIEKSDYRRIFVQPFMDAKIQLTMSRFCGTTSILNNGLFPTMIMMKTQLEEEFVEFD